MQAILLTAEPFFITLSSATGRPSATPHSGAVFYHVVFSDGPAVGDMVTLTAALGAGGDWDFML